MAIRRYILKWLRALQAILDFGNWDEDTYPQFATTKGLGRTGMVACVLGMIWGVHFVLWVQLSLHLIRAVPLSTDTVTLLGGVLRIQLLWQWTAYAIFICTFHLFEFFSTLFYNPSVTSSDSFLVNHSLSYTAATITSALEFLLRFIFFPGFNHFVTTFFGFILTIFAQALRTLAMATAGESFNHNIQTSRKQNHVLVTHGVYHYLRHPSYTGFYVWSISTQLLLGNFANAIAFAILSWHFFNRRVPYEEETLCRLFPQEYPQYVATSYSGIPFLWTQVKTAKAD